MKKFLGIALKVVLSLAGFVIAAAICLCVAILVYSGRDKKNFGQAQQRHIAALEELYSRPGYTPAHEQAMTGFDVEAAASAGVRLNDIRFIGTHNSYKAYNPSAEKLMKYLLAPLRLAEGREWSYGFEPLSEQFGKGIRSIELDVMREKDGFRCAHIPVVDYASNCPDFALALEEIALWSGAHPGHLPITVLIEPKPAILSGGRLFHRFSLDDVLRLDARVSRTLGERLYTPADMLGDYKSFAELRAADDYPELSGLLGKIIVIYHYDEGSTEAYVAHDPALRTQNMFPSTLQKHRNTEYTGRDYACFAVVTSLQSPYLERHMEDNILVRTFVDSYPWRGDEWEAQAVASGAFILSTDFPPREDLGEDPHIVTFEGGPTVAAA